MSGSLKAARNGHPSTSAHGVSLTPVGAAICRDNDLVDGVRVLSSSYPKLLATSPWPGHTNYENVIIQHDKFLSGNMDADGVIDNESATLDEPVLKTILRDLKAVSSKLRAVIFPRSENQLIRDWDLWGPLFLCVFIAVMLHSNDGSGKEPRFTEAFAITWFGACIVTINIKLLGGTIILFNDFYRVPSFICSYCFIDLVLLWFFAEVQIKHHFLMQSRISVGTNKAWFSVCCILLWLIGCIFLAVSIWMLVDPRRRISLDYVNFYENDPLLRYAVSLLMAVGICLVAVGLLGCLAALKEATCLIGFCFVAIIFLLISQCIVSALVAAYYDKVNNRLDGYLYNLIHDRYGRQAWVTELLDSVQFYQKCCGSNSSEDYMFSYWQIVHSPGTVYYVPVSCCAQRQDAYPPHNLYPIDQRCVEYTYDRQPEKAVHKEGCYDKIMTWINENCLIIFSVSLIGILFEIIGLFITKNLFKKLMNKYHPFSTIPASAHRIASCSMHVITVGFFQLAQFAFETDENFEIQISLQMKFRDSKIILSFDRKTYIVLSVRLHFESSFNFFSTFDSYGIFQVEDRLLPVSIALIRSCNNGDSKHQFRTMLL
ncbi:Protein YIPF6 [Trichinella sp. T6]|nr:Protein YIPF6 [Trichinella sp. T6]